MDYYCFNCNIIKTAIPIFSWNVNYIKRFDKSVYFHGLAKQAFLNFFPEKQETLLNYMKETIRKFVELGYLNCIEDIYNLNEYRNEITKLKGFGVKYFDKLINNIKKLFNKVDNK